MTRLNNHKLLENSEPSVHKPLSRKQCVLIPLALFGFIASIYAPSIQYGYIFDESVILFRQVPPRSIHELLQRSWEPHFPGLEYFRPLPHATYLIQYMLHQNEPAYFHAFNATLMGLTGCLVFAFLRLPSFRIGPVPAALAASLFAVHPASSSCVTPIVGRETLLGCFLIIATVYAYFRSGRTWHNASHALFACALLAKEQAIVTPALMLLGDILGLSTAPRPHRPRDWVTRYTPYIVIASIYLWIRWRTFGGTEYSFQLLDDPLAPLTSIAHAIQTVFVPFASLRFEPALDVWLSPVRLGVALALLSIVSWLVAFRRRDLRKVALFWSAWALVAIAPTANFLQQQARYSERYVMMASLAATAVVAALATVNTSDQRRPRLIASTAVVLICVSAATTINRGACFADSLTFSRQWADLNPQFGEAQMLHGIELHLSGHPREAAGYFHTGTRSDGKARAMSHVWLGKMGLVLEDYHAAQRQFQTVLRDAPSSDFVHTLNGIAFRGLQDLTNAESQFRIALQLSPHSGGTAYLLADTLAAGGNSSEAQHYYDAAHQAQLIDLSFSHITDSHLRTICHSSQLSHLILEATSISDDGLTALNNATRLTHLWLPRTKITDRGVSNLTPESTLTSLVLANTHITDDSTHTLCTLRTLRHLDVRYTNISTRGLRRLKTHLPNCLIIH